jgi:hypothetical protein
MMDAQKLYVDYAGHEMTYDAARYAADKTIEREKIAVGPQYAAAAHNEQLRRDNEQLRRDNNINIAANALEKDLAALPKSFPNVYELANMQLPANANKDMKQRVADAKARVAELEAPIRTKKAIFDEQIINRANPNSATTNTKDPFPAPSIPQVGEVVSGYKFKGGNPNDKNNWAKQ